MNSKDSILKRTGEHNICDTIDTIAAKYGLTRFRKFGNTWVGVLNFFDGSDDGKIFDYRSVSFSE